jgi:hypothetical protein
MFRFVIKLFLGFDRKSVIADSVQDLLIWNERMMSGEKWENVCFKT